MRSKSEHPHKKTKWDSNHNQVANDSYSVFERQWYDNQLFYLRAPRNQFEQEHVTINKQLNSNSSCFEWIPNELIREIFEYLPAIDLFRGFYPLNRRFTQLVQQTHLRLDFTGLSLQEFNSICACVNPRQVESLTLADVDLDINSDTQSFGQIALFTYRYILSQFTSLKSLRIIEPNDWTQLQKLLSHLSDRNLKHLSIHLGERANVSEILLSSLFAITTQSLSLKKMCLLDLLTIPNTMNFNQLRRLTLSEISTISLLSLLPHTLHIRYLDVQLFGDDDYDDTDIGYNKFVLNDLTTLRVESWLSSLICVDSYLFVHMPNLKRLSLVGYCDETIDMFAERWQKAITHHVPQLIDFQFYITGPLSDETLTIDEILQPYRKEFWQERHWYVSVDVTEDAIEYLYTLPCPPIRQRPLRMITAVSHIQTTAPPCYALDYSNFNAITSLEVFYAYNHTQTYTCHLLYSNIYSLIIEQQECGVLLGRLIRFSSIRELILSKKMQPISFVYLISMLIRLESLRLLGDAGLLLSRLSEDFSMNECLRVRKIRKLFIDSSEIIRQSDKEKSFSFGRFIQIFGDYLEHLSWVEPPSWLEVDLLINCMSKLKSIMIEWNSNTQLPTHQLSEWLKQKTKLTSFVAKCVKDDYRNTTIWYIWL